MSSPQEYELRASQILVENAKPLLTNLYSGSLAAGYTITRKACFNLLIKLLQRFLGIVGVTAYSPIILTAAVAQTLKEIYGIISAPSLLEYTLKLDDISLHRWTRLLFNEIKPESNEMEVNQLKLDFETTWQVPLLNAESPLIRYSRSIELVRLCNSMIYAFSNVKQTAPVQWVQLAVYNLVVVPCQCKYLNGRFAIEGISKEIFFQTLNLDDTSMPLRCIAVTVSSDAEQMLGYTGHANAIVFNIPNQTVEYFEPVGATTLTPKIVTLLQKFFGKYRVVTPTLECHFGQSGDITSRKGPQTRNEDEIHCRLWSLMYMTYRMVKPELYPTVAVLRMGSGSRKELRERFRWFQNLVHNTRQMVKGHLFTNPNDELITIGSTDINEERQRRGFQPVPISDDQDLN